jgi:hypothetical protein
MANEAQNLYQQGVKAIRDEKDPTQGRQFLVESLRLNPENDAAWVWLSRTVTDTQKKVDCLERALAINPTNQQAAELKSRLMGGMAGGMDASRIETRESKSIPREAQSGTNLGRLVDAVNMNKWHLVVKFIYMAGCLAIAGFLLYLYRDEKIVRPNNQLAILFLPAAGAFLLGAVAFLYSIVISWGIRLEIYERGIARVLGSQRKTWRWEDFSAVRLAEYSFTYRYMGIPVYRLHTYECRLLIYGKVVLTINKDYQRFKALGEYVTQKTSPILFERDLKAYRRGDTVEYGKIRVSHSGIQQGRKSIRWEDIRDWTVSQGDLTIQRRSKGKVTFRMYDVPNAFVLLMLIGNLQHNRDTFG